MYLASDNSSSTSIRVVTSAELTCTQDSLSRNVLLSYSEVQLQHQVPIKNKSVLPLKTGQTVSQNQPHTKSEVLNIQERAALNEDKF